MLNIPIALGVLDGYWSGSAFANVVMRRDIDVLYHYWEPDVTFQALTPVLIVPLEEGIQEPRIIVSSSLEWLAPDARVLLNGMKFDLGNIYEMMSYNEDTLQNPLIANTTFEVSDVASPNQWLAGDAYEGACTWIQNNMDTWKSWIPSKTSCMPGQGLFLNAAWHQRAVVP